MSSPIRLIVLVAAVCALSSCGTSTPTADESSPTSAAKATAPSPTSTTSGGSTTTTIATSTTAPDNASGGQTCPTVPAPDSVASTAPAPFDGDGDAAEDVLTTFERDGVWWMGVQWAAGGSGQMMLDQAESMGAKAIGGFDLNDDGTDEAFLAILGPASGHLIQVFQRDHCGLVPIALENGKPFMFPVTNSIGAFSSARCDGTADITLVTGTVTDPASGTAKVERTTYRFDSASGTMIEGEASTDSVTGDDQRGLGCGELREAMSNLG